MPTITIPKALAQQDDLIVVPRREYEALTELRKTTEFTPIAAQRKALARAEQNVKAGKTFSYHELVRKVDFQTLEDGTVTIRDRDTAKQERGKSPEVSDFLFGNRS